MADHRTVAAWRDSPKGNRSVGAEGGRFAAAIRGLATIAATDTR